MNMRTDDGIELIAAERLEHFNKHNRTITHDVEVNTEYQLATAAARLLFTPTDEGLELMREDFFTPDGWNKKIWLKMLDKSYEERLVIAGALIAAELDRLQYIKENS